MACAQLSLRSLPNRWAFCAHSGTEFILSPATLVMYGLTRSIPAFMLRRNMNFLFSPERVHVPRYRRLDLCRAHDVGGRSDESRRHAHRRNLHLCTLWRRACLAPRVPDEP